MIDPVDHPRPEPEAERVVIVGAGLCGLVVAVELHDRGIPCVILEAADRPGGRVQTIQFPDGMVGEAGMEEFWTSSPAYPLLQRLGLPLRTEPAWSSVILDGWMTPLLSSRGVDAYVDDLVGTASRGEFERWNDSARSILDATNGTTEADLDFASYIHSLHLPSRLRSWIRTIVETESAIEWDRITVCDGLHEMLPFLIPREPSDQVHSVRVEGGNATVIEALLSRLPPDTVRLGAQVTEVSANRTGTRVDVGYTTSDGRRRVVRGHHAVLSAPVWALRSLDIEPSLRQRSRRALDSARFGSYVKIVMRLDCDRLGIWQEDGVHPFTVLTDGPAGCVYLTDGRPSGRDHLLTMLVQGRSARAVAGLGQTEIVRRAIGHLERLAAGTEPRDGGRPTPLLQRVHESLTSAHVVEHQRAVAYWPHALQRSRFDAVADDLRTAHGPVLIGGDTTETSHSDGAIRAAQRMAQVIVQRLGVGERMTA